MKSGHRGRLRNKVIAACTLFALLLSLLIGGIGYYRYKVGIEESYRNYVRTLVSIIASEVDAKHLETVIATGNTDEAFRMLQDELNQVKANSDTEYIYIIYYPAGAAPDTIRYVMTGYTPEELRDEADTLKYLGDPVGEGDFGAEIRARLRESVAADERKVQFFDNKSRVGEDGSGAMEYVKTAYQPIRNAQGELVCFVCADISMTRIYNDLNAYLVTVVIGAAAVAAVFLAVFIYVMNRQVLRPIRAIAGQAEEFVDQTFAAADPSQLQFQEIETGTRDEIQTLAESLNHTMKELVRYMVEMKQLSVTQERIAAELDVARQIQLNLYPCVFPAFPERREFEIYAALESAQGAGGDFYNFFLTDSTHLCVMIGSVSGSGIPATMFAAITATVMKSYAQLGYQPARMMFETNNQLSNNNQAELSACALLGMFDLAAGKFDYVTAGDLVPLIKKSGQVFEPLPHKKGIRLGSMEHVPYFQQSVSLVQGDMLFCYTPGVAETADERGNVYSDVYVAEQMNRITRREIRLERIVGVMSDDLSRFRGNGIREQDNTMLMLRYYG